MMVRKLFFLVEMFFVSIFLISFISASNFGYGNDGGGFGYNSQLNQKEGNVTIYNNNSYFNITNSYGGSSINASSTTCTGNNKFNSFNNATGIFGCVTDNSSAGGLSSADVNLTINNYLGSANLSYLSTYNSTYESYRTNVSINWTEVIFNLYNSTWDNSYLIGLTNCDDGHCGNVFYWNNQSFLNETNLVNIINSSLNSVNSSLWIINNSLFNLATSINNSVVQKWMQNFTRLHITNITGITTCGANEASKYNGTDLICVSLSTSNVLNYSNFSNYTYYWGNNINSTNSTQITNVQGILTILESWLRNLISSIGNEIGFNSTYNKTYEDYALNVSKNWTEITVNSYNGSFFNDGNNTGLSSADVNQSILNYQIGMNNSLNITIAQYQNLSLNQLLNLTIRAYVNSYNSTQNVSLNQLLNLTIAWYQNLSLNQVLNSTINIYFSGANASYSAVINLSIEQRLNMSINDFLNKTINLYLNTGTNASYLSTYNSTYESYRDNVSRNWSLDTFNNWGTWSFNQTLNLPVQWLFNQTANLVQTYWFNQTANLVTNGDNASWNESYARSILTSNASINQYLTNANASYLTTFNSTYHTWSFNQTLNLPVQWLFNQTANLVMTGISWLDARSNFYEINATYNKTEIEANNTILNTSAYNWGGIVNKTGIQALTINQTAQMGLTINTTVNTQSILINDTGRYNTMNNITMLNLTGIQALTINTSLNTQTVLINNSNRTINDLINRSIKLNSSDPNILWENNTNQVNITSNWSTPTGMFNDTNSSQFESVSGMLHIVESWLVAKITALVSGISWLDARNNFYEINSTYNKTEINNINTTLDGRIVLVNNSATAGNLSSYNYVKAVNTSLSNINVTLEGQIIANNKTVNIGILYNYSASLITNTSIFWFLNSTIEQRLNFSINDQINRTIKLNATDPNIVWNNKSNIFGLNNNFSNLTIPLEHSILFENPATYMYSNVSCVIIKGSVSTFNIC
jgi:hypothetical protein